MNWLRQRLNPVTMKRLRRFREMKRAYWSCRILVGLYLVSLAAPLLCNDKPLYVRFEGRSYFPVFTYYPDDAFTGSGKQTRPDYRALKRSEPFAAGRGNRMVFPPVPYGPLEVLHPDAIEVPQEVTVRFAPVPRVGRVNVDAELVVVRSAAAGFFFGVQNEALKGMSLSSAWKLPDVLHDAIRQRFANEAAPPVKQTVRSALDPSRRAEISLSTYRPRTRSPRSVRLTFRETGLDEAAEQKLVFRDAALPARTPPLWARCSEAQRQELLASARARFGRPVQHRQIVIDGAAYRLSFEKTDVRWPFRPVRGHWLGIDNAGRDVFARILYGLRTSMTFGLILVVVSMVLGTIIGSIQGYFAGLVDLTVQRLIEIWSALPFLYIMILLGSVYGRSFGLLLVVYGIFRWIGISYYMRAEFLRLRRLTFVEAAKCLGVPTHRIIFKHILPNALVPVITLFPFSLVGAIGSLAVLDYLGFGLPPPTPSWGELFAQAQQVRWAWWLVMYPFVALFVVILLGVFIGEGVRNAFDPRRYSRME